MKTIIAGSRDITNYRILLDALTHIDWEITEVVSGTCKGADLLGEQYANRNDLPIERYPADWKRYGKRAGYLRNTEMVENAQACIVLWDGRSKGAKMMIRIAKQHGLDLVVYKQVWKVERFRPNAQLEMEL